jgi:hypothetical protein
MCLSRPGTLRHLPFTSLKTKPRLVTAQTRLVIPESTTVKRFFNFAQPLSAKGTKTNMK